MLMYDRNILDEIDAQSDEYVFDLTLDINALSEVTHAVLSIIHES